MNSFFFSLSLSLFQYAAYAHTEMYMKRYAKVVDDGMS